MWQKMAQNVQGKVPSGELAAGANPILVGGKTPSSTNIPVLVDANGNVLVSVIAGSALMGKVGIDQTTANANEVVVKSITAGDNNIGNVDIASALPAGTNLLGKVGIDQTTPGTTNGVSIVGSLAKASDTILIGTGAAHSAGDVVSTDAGEILQFSTGLTAGTGGIILDSLVTLDQNAVFSGGAGYTLYLFNVSPTAQATNAVFDLDSLTGYVGKIIISTLVDRGSNCEAEDVGHNKSFTLAAADTKLYGKLVCTGAETTITAKTITINLNIVSA
jgi:hypothetical protein